MKESYKTIAKSSEGLFKSKGSKFFAYAFHVRTAQDIQSKLNLVKEKHPKARHHCYAWKLGFDDNQYRVNDDGEPSGTAGKPIFGQIRSFELTNVLIVVVRYFGGTLLGASGLIEAYKLSARDAISNNKIVERNVKNGYIVAFDYVAMNTVMQLIKKIDAEVISKQFEASCRIELCVNLSQQEIFESAIEKIDQVDLTNTGIQ